MQKRILRKYDGSKLIAHRLLVFVVILFLVMILAFTFVIGFSSVSGNSMYPTLKNGQAVVYVRLKSKYAYGDIVSLHMTSGERYVKRVIGVPGDTIDLRDGKIYINGNEEEGAWVNQETYPEQSGVVYPLTLDKNQYFTLGDNRAVSTDSRSYGYVTKKQISGKILFQ